MVESQIPEELQGLKNKQHKICHELIKLGRINPLIKTGFTDYFTCKNKPINLNNIIEEIIPEQNDNIYELVNNTENLVSISTACRENAKNGKASCKECKKNCHYEISQVLMLTQSEIYNELKEHQHPIYRKLNDGKKWNKNQAAQDLIGH